MRITVPEYLQTALLAVLIAAPAVAQDDQREAIEVADLGPQIGETVPDFRLPDQNGQFHTLDDIKGPNGTMLLFHRSADW